MRSRVQAGSYYDLNMTYVIIFMFVKCEKMADYIRTILLTCSSRSSSCIVYL